MSSANPIVKVVVVKVEVVKVMSSVFTVETDL